MNSSFAVFCDFQKSTAAVDCRGWTASSSLENNAKTRRLFSLAKRRMKRSVGAAAGASVHAHLERALASATKHQPHPNRPKPTLATKPTLSLEGNIAAGKSTMLRHLANEPNICPVHEPVGVWQSVGPSKTNLLHLFYSDPNRWAFTFQAYAFLSRAKAAASHVRDAQTPTSAAFMLERSLHSDKQCFAQNAYNNGLFQEVEMAIYDDFYSWILSETPSVQSDGFVYLRASPETCLCRSQKRARDEESALSLEYLHQLHSLHEGWLLPDGVAAAAQTGRSVSADGRPVLVLDCDVEFADDDELLRSMRDRIMEFVDELAPRASGH